MATKTNDHDSEHVAANNGELGNEELREVSGGKAGDSRDEYYKIVMKDVLIAGV